MIGFLGRGEFSLAGNPLRILTERAKRKGKGRKKIRETVGLQDDKLRRMVTVIELLFSSLDVSH